MPHETTFGLFWQGIVRKVIFFYLKTLHGQGHGKNCPLKGAGVEMTQLSPMKQMQTKSNKNKFVCSWSALIKWRKGWEGSSIRLIVTTIQMLGGYWLNADQPRAPFFELPLPLIFAALLSLPLTKMRAKICPCPKRSSRSRSKEQLKILEKHQSAHEFAQKSTSFERKPNRWV